MKTIDRISDFINSRDISFNAFDQSIGRPKGYIGKQIRNQASIGSDILETILLTYKEINPQWLIAGEGEMLRTNSKNNHVLEDGVDYETDFFELSLLKYLDKPRIKKKILKIIDDDRKEE